MAALLLVSCLMAKPGFPVCVSDAPDHCCLCCTRALAVFLLASSLTLDHHEVMKSANSCGADKALLVLQKGSGTARSRGHDTASNFSLSQNPRFAGRHGKPVNIANVSQKLEASGQHA